MRYNFLKYFLAGALLGLLLTLIKCEGSNGVVDDNDTVKIDTVYVDRIIKIPEIREVFKDRYPEPVIIYKADPDLLKQFEELEDENEKLKRYAEAITKRDYEKTYVSTDSIVKITVKNSVTGTLDFQSVDFTVAEQEAIFREKVITKTIEKRPDFALSLGAGIKVPTILSAPLSFEAVIGVKSKKGFTYQLGVDTDKEFRFTLTKDIFIKY